MAFTVIKTQMQSWAVAVAVTSHNWHCILAQPISTGQNSTSMEQHPLILFLKRCLLEWKEAHNMSIFISPAKVLHACVKSKPNWKCSSVFRDIRQLVTNRMLILVNGRDANVNWGWFQSSGTLTFVWSFSKINLR